jgi:hypothetical protein
MSKQFEDMQRLAFGKVLINESAQMTKSDLKNKIREMVLDEAKKKKKSKPENVAPQEDVDIDIAAEVPTEPSMDAAPAEPTSGGNVIRDIQNLLQDAFEKAQQLPDNEDKEKTINQISNTIKMFINTQVLGSGQQPGIAEDLNESEEYNTGEKYSYRGKMYDIWVDDEHNRYIKIGGRIIDI